MGVICCKRHLPEARSPKMSCCEVIRRFTRTICPLEPPVQTTVNKPRKYKISDIVGPTEKKNSWCQTDPLPPPRYKRKRPKLQRRRSRSVEFLPYLIREARTAGSLEDLRNDQADILDFQMFMDRLPKNTSDGDKAESTDVRRKEFLSSQTETKNSDVLSAAEGADESDSRNDDTPVQNSSDSSSQQLSSASNNDEVANSNSRRSSITESLREFESSLLEMLDEEEGSSLQLRDGRQQRDRGQRDGDEAVRAMQPHRNQELSPLEECEEENAVVHNQEEHEKAVKNSAEKEQSDADERNNNHTTKNDEVINKLQN